LHHRQRPRRQVVVLHKCRRRRQSRRRRAILGPLRGFLQVYCISTELKYWTGVKSNQPLNYVKKIKK
jgi:hypothetical protein